MPPFLFKVDPAAAAASRALAGQERVARAHPAPQLNKRTAKSRVAAISRAPSHP
jgi:hypothetical protein